VRLTDGVVALRPWKVTDAGALEPACGDPGICRFTTIPWRYTLPGVLDWVARQEKKRCEGVTVALAIVREGENVPLGTVALSDPDWKARRASLGYWLMRGERGAGLATRGCALARDWAFGELGLQELEVSIETGNDASFGVARRLGADDTGEQVTESLHGEEMVLARWVLRPPGAPQAGS
jgi:RimJ/RimL family protein N-acetyltransferase